MTYAAAQYRAVSVQTAAPVYVVVQLYDAALRQLSVGRDALEQQNAARAGHALGRAHAIVSELQASLDRSQAPALCAELSGLYDFCLHRIREATTKKAPGLLEAVARVLRELRGAWAELAQRSP